MSKYKYGTARIALFKEFDIEKSYTLEASLYGSKNQHFSLEDYLEIGKNFIIGLFLLFHEEEINARVLKILIAKNMDTFNNLGEEASLEKDIKNLVGSVCFKAQSKIELPEITTNGRVFSDIDKLKSKYNHIGFEKPKSELKKKKIFREISLETLDCLKEKKNEIFSIKSLTFLKK